MKFDEKSYTNLQNGHEPPRLFRNATKTGLFRGCFEMVRHIGSMPTQPPEKHKADSANCQPSPESRSAPTEQVS